MSCRIMIFFAYALQNYVGLGLSTNLHMLYVFISSMHHGLSF